MLVIYQSTASLWLWPLSCVCVCTVAPALCGLLYANSMTSDWNMDIVAAAVKLVTRGTYRVLLMFDPVGRA